MRYNGQGFKVNVLTRTYRDKKEVILHLTFNLKRKQQEREMNFFIYFFQLLNYKIVLTNLENMLKCLQRL